MAKPSINSSDDEETTTIMKTTTKTTPPPEKLRVRLPDANNANADAASDTACDADAADKLRRKDDGGCGDCRRPPSDIFDGGCCNRRDRCCNSGHRDDFIEDYHCGNHFEVRRCCDCIAEVADCSSCNRKSCCKFGCRQDEVGCERRCHRIERDECCCKRERVCGRRMNHCDKKISKDYGCCKREKTERRSRNNNNNNKRKVPDRGESKCHRLSLRDDRRSYPDEPFPKMSTNRRELARLSRDPIAANDYIKAKLMGEFDAGVKGDSKCGGGCGCCTRSSSRSTLQRPCACRPTSSSASSASSSPVASVILNPLDAGLSRVEFAVAPTFDPRGASAVDVAPSRGANHVAKTTTSRAERARRRERRLRDCVFAKVYKCVVGVAVTILVVAIIVIALWVVFTRGGKYPGCKEECSEHSWHV